VKRGKNKQTEREEKRVKESVFDDFLGLNLKNIKENLVSRKF
jgi:hypothetical protein